MKIYLLRVLSVQGNKINCVSSALNSSIYIIPYSTFNSLLTIGLKYVKTTLVSYLVQGIWFETNFYIAKMIVYFASRC